MDARGHGHKKRRMARLVSPLFRSGSYARLPILRQRENYTWKRPEEASQEKAVFAGRTSSCVTAPVTVGNAGNHPGGDFAVQPGDIFAA